MLIFQGILGLFWGGQDKEDVVPSYIKHQLLRAQRALRDGDYTQAEDCYHRALHRLATSTYAQSQPYIEARAVVLDKVTKKYNKTLLIYLSSSLIWTPIGQIKVS